MTMMDEWRPECSVPGCDEPAMNGEKLRVPNADGTYTMLTLSELFEQRLVVQRICNDLDCDDDDEYAKSIGCRMIKAGATG